jgi:serine protease Do
MHWRVGNSRAILTMLVVVLTACGPTETGIVSPPTATSVPVSTAMPGVPVPISSGANGAGSPVPTIFSAVQVVKDVGPAVVTVVNEQQVGGLGSNLALETGRGTGFIIDDVGHIVTNWHVVNGGDQFEVIFADGEKRPVTVAGADRLSDLAVVQVEGPLPAIVPFGNSDALEPGLPVLAIGSPLGTFTNTVTDGIVSGLGRDLPGSPAQGAPIYKNLIQHDAPINPGNSGGPLFDYNGQVVGVNTLGIPEVPGEGIPVQGLFFAIPSNTVQTITSQLIESGRVAYPYMAVQTQEITPELASLNELPIDHGAYVLGVDPNGPAAQAGIQQGDFILALGHVQIDEQTSFTEALFAFRPDDTIEVTVLRGRKELKLPVTLAELPPQ